MGRMDNEWEELKPQMQAFGERLLKAGWAETLRIDDGGVIFVPTKVGKRRVRQLWKIFRELEAQELPAFEKDFLFLLVFKEAERLGWK
jgi:hypothetical protein